MMDGSPFLPSNTITGVHPEYSSCISDGWKKVLGSHVTIAIIRVSEPSITVLTPITRITVFRDVVNFKLLCSFKAPTAAFAIEWLGNVQLLMSLHIITPLS